MNVIHGEFYQVILNIRGALILLPCVLAVPALFVAAPESADHAPDGVECGLRAGELHLAPAARSGL